MRVRVTYTIPEETEELLTEMYIKRLKNKKPEASRSAIVAEAIRYFWQWEGKK